MTVIYIDVNGLHELNNRLGHAAGDEMLRFVAKACVERFPKADVFRLGGDEFLIISENEEAAAFRRRLEAFQKLCETKEDEIEISCCIGYYADQPHTEKDLRTMINNADYYLYQAKNEGESRIDGASAEIKEGGSSSMSVS